MNYNKKHYKIKIISFLIAILMVLDTAPIAYGATTTKLNFSVDDVIDKTSQYIINSSKSYNSPWAILGLARSEVSVDSEYYEKYYTNLEQLLEDKSGVLNERMYSDYSGAILALSAIGKDPTNIVGYNLLEKLADFNNVVAQGINGAVWALLAIDACDYEIPQVDNISNITTREKLINYILSREIIGGGWSMGETTPDPDVTAMVMQALAKYNGLPNVEVSVERGLTWLSTAQQNNGGYESWETKNSESDSQVIVALCSLGINPQTDVMFVKQTSNNVLSNIINNFYVSSGGFMHTEKTSVDGLATIQGFHALVAYDRLLKGKPSLYNMSDVEKKYDDNNQTNDTTSTQTAYENKFTDIEQDTEKESIIYLNGEGIIKGMTETLFAPEDNITRAQFAALISRALSLEEVKTNSFSDVADENWFSGYVGAVQSAKIVLGYEDGTFRPANYITRQEAALMVARAAKILGIDTSVDNAEIINTLCQFVDYVECDDWSMEAMASCIKNGYIPDEEMNIYPKRDASRSEIAGMVYRMLKD
ncbi:MAG: S-layer homology domain-containing protein [Sedimentibacter sp.]